MTDVTVMVPPAERASTRTLDRYVRWFETLALVDDVLVGGKAANLGELVKAGAAVPPGFALTADAYLDAVERAGVRTSLRELFDSVEPNRTDELAGKAACARELLATVLLTEDVQAALVEAYRALRAQGAVRVAVRSSAAGEDSATTSFAGMNESFTNVVDEAGLINAVRACWRSLYGERVVNYRAMQGLAAEPAIAVIVQRMVAADASGVAFTLDPTGREPDALVIEAARGQGEVVVGGQVEPDHYLVRRLQDGRVSLRQATIGDQSFEIVAGSDGRDERRVLEHGAGQLRVLEDQVILDLAELALAIERHYGSPQDIEWCVEKGRIWFVQSRPITTLGPVAPQLRAQAPVAITGEATPVLTGLAASHGVGAGVVRILNSPKDGARLAAGEVLVAEMTKPDWLPIMRRAAAVVTNSGGVTCHAAIVCRELGIPCVVGARGATTTLRDGEPITVDADHGKIYAGLVALTPEPAATAADATLLSGVALDAASARPLGTKILVNLALPDEAERAAKLAVDGVGLLRAELLVTEALGGQHPRALLAAGNAEGFVSAMAQALIRIGRAFGSRPVVYRAIDFRSNEFRDLAGGDEFEPVEANPMIGYRGCYRYVREPDLFGLELDALARARRETPNVQLMIPFVRTPWELAQVFDMIDASPLGTDHRLQRWIMAEVPSVVYRLADYAGLGVHGVSIGSNDLTQLMLGVDRDSALLADLFDEADEAVLDAIEAIVSGAKALGMAVSLCGQAPSRNPAFAARLVEFGIDSISVDSSSVSAVRAIVGSAETAVLLAAARNNSHR